VIRSICFLYDAYDVYDVYDAQYATLLTPFPIVVVNLAQIYTIIMNKNNRPNTSLNI